MNGNSEEMFIHFAYYRGEAKKKGLMFAAVVSDEEPVIVEMFNEYIPENIVSKLNDHEVRKYYILTYDIFSEMLRICNIRRNQGRGSWISIGRRLAWLGVCDEWEADEKRLAELFPATGRMVKKYEKEYLSFCYPDKYFGRMYSPDAHIDEWQNMKRYMSAVVKLEQEFVYFCRTQAISFRYENICCYGIWEYIADSILEEAWLRDGRIHNKGYWNKRCREWKESIAVENGYDEERQALAVKLKKEYALSYTANVSAVRWLSSDAMSVWNGDRCRTPEFMQRYMPENIKGKYCMLEFSNLVQRVLLQQVGVSTYAADRVCKIGLSTEETGKLNDYLKMFTETMIRVIEEHSGEEVGEYRFSWFGQVLIIRHKTLGMVMLINKPKKTDDIVWSISVNDGFIISIPRLIGYMVYRQAEILCMKKYKEFKRFGIGIVSVSGCRILARVPSNIDEGAYKEISMKLRVEKYGVSPEFLFGRSTYGNDE